MHQNVSQQLACVKRMTHFFKKRKTFLYFPSCHNEDILLSQQNGDEI